MKPSPAFGDKRYAVLGLARTGLSVVDYLWRSSIGVTAWDDREEAREQVEGKARIDDFIDEDLTHFAAIVVSPGVPLNSHPIAERARAAGVPLICDIELFAQARRDLPAHKLVGVTGTNGKSTTAALIHHMIETAGIPTLLGGNIGNPILSEEALPEGGVYVLELSSFQIDLTFSLDCEVAALTNITPDHLDRYDGFEAYAASKARLFDMQSGDHTAIIAIDDAPSAQIAWDLQKQGRSPARVIRIAAGGCMDQSRWPALQGPHNAENALIAMSAARALGVPEPAIGAALESFPGLPHRMERIGERDGVAFVNDSKATNPTSTAPALAAFPKIHWILGGRAKTDNLDACAPWFDHVRAAYTIGEAAPLFEALLAPHMTVRDCGEIKRAVRIAADAAKAGETVLLSPACASFDQFSDYEARGEAFRAAVRGLE